jgi:hypothetical protein
VPLQIANNTNTTSISQWAPASLTPGPYFASFEQFRTTGISALESINPTQVATLAGRSAVYRILRDTDFQRLLGLATDVHRIKGGMTVVIQAARVAAKHKDEESLELLVRSVSMLTGSSILPEKQGHDAFEITPEEAAENSDDLAMTELDIPRPKL